MVAAACACSGLAGLPLVAHAQEPAKCPSSELAALDPEATPEVTELRGLRVDLRQQCEALYAQQGAQLDVLEQTGQQLGEPLTVTWPDPLPVKAAIDGTVEAEMQAPEWAQPLGEDIRNAIWVLVGVSLGVFLGGLLYRAVIG